VPVTIGGDSFDPPQEAENEAEVEPSPLEDDEGETSGD
jgi:hypothetical protein